MYNRREALLRGVATTTFAALALAGCSSSNTTIQTIIDWLVTNCKFTTDVNNIAQVIATIVTGFNAAAGAATTVAIAVATQVEQLVCSAVQTQATNLSAEKRGAKATPMTVVVNGVQVTGTYAG